MRRRIPKPAGYCPALRRLGLAAPPPFVGRESELAVLGRALQDAVILVAHGAVGAGKTRLARALMTRPDITSALTPAYVRCTPGDVGVAVRARAERALDSLPAPWRRPCATSFDCSSWMTPTTSITTTPPGR